MKVRLLFLLLHFPLISICQENDTLKANSLIDRIVTLRKNKDIKSALEESIKAEQFILEKLGESHQYYTEVTYYLALNYATNYRFQEAIPFFERTIALRYKYWGGEKKLSLADIINESGYTYFQAQQYEKAYASFGKAIEILKALGKGDSNEVADYNVNLGIAYQATEEFDKAITHLLEGIKIYSSNPDEQFVRLSRAYNNIGVVYDMIGDYRASNQYFRKSLDLRLEKYGKFGVATSIGFSNYGNNFMNRGLYKMAIDFYEQAEQACINSTGNDLRCLENLYNVYTSLGSCYNETNQKELANSYLYKALNIALELFGTDNVRTISAMNNIATQLDPDLQKAEKIDLYKQVIDGYTSLFKKPSSYEIAPLENLGWLHIYSKEYQLAEGYFRKALTVADEVYEGYHPAKAKVELDLAILEQRRGNYQHSIHQLKELIKRGQMSLGNHHPLMAENHRRLSTSYREINSLELALAHIDSAIHATNYQVESIEQVNSVSELFAAFGEKVNLLNLIAAQERNVIHLVRSKELLDDLFEMVDQYRLDPSVRKSNVFISHLTYEDAIKTCMGLRNESPMAFRDAFRYLQRSKAARLFAGLQESNARQFAGIPDELLYKEEQLRADITTLEKKAKTETGCWPKCDRSISSQPIRSIV